jgi:hypothetical protein
MCRILLLDVDSKIPNLALMKLSAYYKSLGDTVELKRLGVSYFPTRRGKPRVLDVEKYDKVFVSAIFPGSKQSFSLRGDSEIGLGGTGLNISAKLPEHIEALKPDYSIYPDNKFSYGFLTRGCIRNCSFCLVRQKEGGIRLDTPLEDIIQHDKVKFMDNNILAHPEHLRLLREIRDSGIQCQFNQGLDIRLVTEDNAKLLSEIKYLGEYIFAFDRLSDEAKVSEKLKIFKFFVPKDWKTKFFVYCHPDMDIESDIVYRCEWLRRNGALPYLMRDISCWDSANCDFYVDLCAYVNQPNLFKKMSFEEYMEKRQPNNRARRERSLALYRGEIK